jgi:hypothetical protein
MNVTPNIFTNIDFKVLPPVSAITDPLSDPDNKILFKIADTLIILFNMHYASGGHTRVYNVSAAIERCKSRNLWAVH